LFYKGGQFMPTATAGMVAAPAKLEGSSRQVAWASRLRNEGLAKLDAMLTDVNAALKVAARHEAPALRTVARTLATTRLLVKNERSAARII
jgi:hypothetical protein